MEKKPLLRVPYWLVLLILCVALPLLASDILITGTVVDFETKEALPYTNIVVAGKQQGTISNSEGNFTFETGDSTLSDTIIFQHLGYKTVKIKASELQKSPTVAMYPDTSSMAEVQVGGKVLPAEEIIKRAYRNFEKNHTTSLDKQRIFFHKYVKIPFQKENKLVLKETNFVGLDKKTFEDVMKKMPAEFVEYQDAIVELYHNGSSHKLVPIKGISMEEGAQQALFKEFEKKLGSFFEDIEKSMGEKDIYYKIRSGILGQKIGNKKKDKSEWNNNKNNQQIDTLNYTVPTEQARNYLLTFLKNYTRAESSNWEFINSTNKYLYTLEGTTMLDDEPVYEISFTPKKRGLFEGTVYISTISYAILQLDFVFAKGKRSDVFNLFGYKHATNFREAHLIFEKGKTGYYLKYMYAKEREYSSIDRDFSIMKKQKRLLIDKELNEIKMQVELIFNSDTYWELLVLERKEITAPQFEKVTEPAVMKLRKEYAYTPAMWENRTNIVPASELKKYKSK